MLEFIFCGEYFMRGIMQRNAVRKVSGVVQQHMIAEFDAAERCPQG